MINTCLVVVGNFLKHTLQSPQLLGVNLLIRKLNLSCGSDGSFSNTFRSAADCFSQLIPLAESTKKGTRLSDMLQNLSLCRWV